LGGLRWSRFNFPFLQPRGAARPTAEPHVARINTAAVKRIFNLRGAPAGQVEANTWIDLPMIAAWEDRAAEASSLGQADGWLCDIPAVLRS
jgi:hypothetical protein